MLQNTMLRRAQTLQRDRHATAVAGSHFTGALHRNTARHPSGGAERGSRAPGGAIRTGIIAAAIIFHQETSDVRPDLMVDEGGGVRSGPGVARTILLFHIISARPSKQPLMVRTFLNIWSLAPIFCFCKNK